MDVSLSDPGGARRSPRGAARDVVEADALVLLEPLGGAFPPEARLLDAAERRGRVGRHALVDADDPGLETVGDGERAVEALGEHVAREAELGVIGPGDGLVLGREALDRRDR